MKITCIEDLLRNNQAFVAEQLKDDAGYFDKLAEETDELREAMAGPEDKRQSRLEDEIGDILFVIVNLARFLKIDSESALKRANRKFKTRFQKMEAKLAGEGKSLDGTSLDEIQTLWEQAKAETADS